MSTPDSGLGVGSLKKRLEHRDGFESNGAKQLTVPETIVLMFQPAHSPECNPIEQVWQYLKRRLWWQRPKDVRLRELIRVQLLNLSP